MLLLGTNYDNMVSDSCINEDMTICFLISYEWRYDRGHINNENYHFVQILWLWSTTLCKCNLCCYFCDRTYLNSVCVSDLVHWVFVTNNIGCLYPHSQQINFRFGYNCYYKITVKWFEIIRFHEGNIRNIIKLITMNILHHKSNPKIITLKPIYWTSLRLHYKIVQCSHSL